VETEGRVTFTGCEGDVDVGIEAEGSMKELRRVLERLHDTEASSGTLSVEELEELKLIISMVNEFTPMSGYIAELEDNFEELKGEHAQLTARNLDLENAVKKVREIVGSL
jgi:hypothetical protein